MDVQAHCAGRAGAVQPRPRRADAPARACHHAARAYAVQSPGPARSLRLLKRMWGGYQMKAPSMF